MTNIALRNPRGTRATSPPRRSPQKAAPRTTSTMRFPGCKAKHMTSEEVADYDGRFEFWDGDTETVWMVREPTGPVHENAAQALSEAMALVAAVRGSPIRCYGAMDLLLRGPDGERRRIMQADQSVYLQPERADMLSHSAMAVGENHFPNVVLEVDHTTDVRRNKLRLYEEWGFPEVWVEVPDRPPRSGRRRGVKPGLTVYLRTGERFTTSVESLAFPGWSAADIHSALNETTFSEATCRMLERLGKTLGDREGTGPDDDPLLRSQRREAFERGLDEGLLRGLLAALPPHVVRGPASQDLSLAERILKARNVQVGANFHAQLAAFGDLPLREIMACAGTAESEDEFWQLARVSRSGHPRAVR